MKVIVSEKTREKINSEYTRFMADPNNLARLKMKLTLDQRVFIESLQESYRMQAENSKDKDKLLLLQEAILTFNARPELVPNAPIDLLKKNVTFKDSPDDFEQMIVLIKVWKTSVDRSKKPINRLGVFFAKWPKYVLYPIFVSTLITVFLNILNLLTTYYIYSTVDIGSIVLVLGAIFMSTAIGRAIYFRILAINMIKAN